MLLYFSIHVKKKCAYLFKILGAVGGIAEQPLQIFTKDSDMSTTVRLSSGLVTGVGKGLVGAVTKPLGGAAELVSQTGLGLLQGAGLTSLPSPRHPPKPAPHGTGNTACLKLVE